MPTVTDPARAAHPISTRSGDPWLDTRLAPLAAELVCAVRDLGPDDTAGILARIPDGDRDTFTLLLAAMVDPDRTLAELLDWLTAGPVPSRDGRNAARQEPCPDCGEFVHAKHIARHRRRHHDTPAPAPVSERDRLAGAGVSDWAADVLTEQLRSAPGRAA